MKTIAILWNSMEDNFNDALEDINEQAHILDCFKVDFNNNFDKFISDIYPYSGDEKWKLEYKINAMNNKYKKNEVLILFLDIPSSNKIYCERKNIYLYENVEKLKKCIRDKYKNIVKNYSFDNIFHMTDDELEFDKTLLIIKKHFILSWINNRKGFIRLNDYLINDKDIIETNELNGKREKFWFADMLFMYKKEKFNSYELYSELFADEIARILGLKCSTYFPAIYNNSRGVITLNFIEREEEFISGSKIIDFYLNEKKTEEIISPIEFICKFNNFEQLPSIIKNYCLKNNLYYNPDIILELKKYFVFDFILLQTDRNPNNWGILLDKKNNTIRLAPLYDNSNIMGMNKSIEQIVNLSLMDIYKLPTSLLLDVNDNFFDHKLSLLQKIEDNYIIDIFNEYLNMLINIDIDLLFSKVEKLYGINIPNNFKTTMNRLFSFNINNLYSIINKKNYEKTKK